MWKALADIFLRDWPRTQAELTTAFEKADVAKLEFLAHRLSGQASMIGADASMSAAQRLEDAAAMGDLEVAKQEMDCLQALMEQLPSRIASLAS